MEVKKRRTKNNEKMNVRDYITAAIMYVLMFLVYAGVGAPIGMTVAGSLFVFAACAVVWGTIFMLLFTKVNKKGVVLLFGLIWAAMQLMSFWGVAIVIAIGAVIAELLWDKLDRRKFSTMLLCFTVQVIFLYLGMTLPLIFMKDMYLAAVSAYADLYSTVFNMLIGPMFFVGLAATVVGCIVGAFLGKLLLKKHFEKAGIV
ncbi:MULTISPECIES: MptD family putative ECF transporter S component [Clostridia]|uniref:MptD family putative ECF transporter S component n=1 Tax=Clostridia TaxID=186801 RepID=UPI0008636B11|nr:MptD family putative ECF transporter S component [Merdimonas faecis]